MWVAFRHNLYYQRSNLRSTLEAQTVSRVFKMVVESLRRPLLLCVAGWLLPLVCAGCSQHATASLEKHGTNVKRLSPATRVVYVALGDSTGIGLGARNGGGYVDQILTKIRRTHSDSKLVNLSAAGATVTQVLQSQIPRMGDAGPTVVTLGIGANDALEGVDEEQFAEEYEQAVTQIVRTGPPLIVVMTIPDIDSAPAMRTSGRSDIAAHVGNLNRRIRDIASKHGLLLVDLHDAGTKEELSRPEFFSSDGFHPSDKGYALWAEAIWRTLAPAIEG